MKILFYINTISHGGAERVMVNLSSELAGRGHDVVLVTSYVEQWEYQTSPLVKRINLSDTRISGFLKRNIKLTKALRSVIKSEKPEIVISFLVEPNFRNIIATRGLKVKTMISIRNDPDKRRYTKLNWFLMKHLYKKADGVVFQTEEARGHFSKKIQSKSRVIMNQVDGRFFETKYEGERENIIATGRLTGQKNHKMLLDAFALIKDKTEENLVIYGEGELREALEEYAERIGLGGRVILPGATKNVPEAIKAARLYVMSSDYEGMPNALIEAMALGLPCVSTDCPCGGPRVLLGELSDDCLVPVNEPAAFAASMLKMLSMSDEELDAIRSKIRATAEQCRGDKVICDWEQYINDIVRGK